MSKETLTKSIREIPDFPIPGILFYDVTTLFKEPTALQELSDTLYEMYKDKRNNQSSGYRIKRFHYGPHSRHQTGSRLRTYPQAGKTSCRNH